MFKSMQDFYINMLNLLSVLLTGVVLTACLFGMSPMQEWMDGRLEDSQAYRGMFGVFFFTLSFTSGHFIVAVSQKLEWLYGVLNARLWPEKPGGLSENARRIKEQQLNHRVSGVYNTYQWAKSFVYAMRPAMYADIQRYESEGGFFRSMCLLFGILTVLALVSGFFDVGIALLVLSILAAWQFLEHRHSASLCAFEYVITLDALMHDEKV
ncbi:MAG: hypothetical protein IT270_14570 [Saprospiraceae bacterium]|nr:hypothetical protein [Saprospiraceae bacterium]